MKIEEKLSSFNITWEISSSIALTAARQEDEGIVHSPRPVEVVHRRTSIHSQHRRSGLPPLSSLRNDAMSSFTWRRQWIWVRENYFVPRNSGIPGWEWSITINLLPIGYEYWFHGSHEKWSYSDSNTTYQKVTTPPMTSVHWRYLLCQLIYLYQGGFLMWRTILLEVTLVFFASNAEWHDLRTPLKPFKVFLIAFNVDYGMNRDYDHDCSGEEIGR